MPVGTKTDVKVMQLSNMANKAFMQVLIQAKRQREQQHGEQLQQDQRQQPYRKLPLMQGRRPPAAVASAKTPSRKQLSDHPTGSPQIKAMLSSLNVKPKNNWVRRTTPPPDFRFEP